MIKDVYGNTRFYGIYRALVVDNQDPNGIRRLRLQIPQVLFDQVTDWAWEQENSGQFLPGIGDGVWVNFEGGDPSYPVWGGTFSKTTDLIDGGSA